jgi:RNA polymerase-binding transcription factor DksA
MSTIRYQKKASRKGASAKGTGPRPLSTLPVSPRIPARWAWHYRTLSLLRERLFGERRGNLQTAADPIEHCGMDDADAATDEFDHELAVSQLSAEQDALYEIDAALQRIITGAYGLCEETGTRIPAARLRAIPWTRYCAPAAARLERSGHRAAPHLGALRSLREQPAEALAETRPSVDQPEVTVNFEELANGNHERRHDESP